MVSRRLSPEEMRQDIKADPDFDPSDPAGIMDYSHLLSQVEVKIKTEPPEYEENLGLSGWNNSNIHCRAATSLHLWLWHKNVLIKYLSSVWVLNMVRI